LNRNTAAAITFCILLPCFAALGCLAGYLAYLTGFSYRLRFLLDKTLSDLLN